MSIIKPKESKGSDPLGIKDLILYTIIVVITLLRLAPTAFASSTVVINEICPACDPEWVELYNNASNEVNLVSWQLIDANNSSSDDLTLTGIISANGFIIFENSKKWLNNDGDTLTLKNSNQETVDATTFGNFESGKTTSRVPDGTGNFQENTVATKNSANQALPTPTPSPTPSPTLTPTPKPTSTPKPATATPVQTNTSTPTLTPTSTLTTTDDNSSPKVLARTDENPQPEVDLEIIDLTATAESEINPSPTSPPEKSGRQTSPVFIISAAGAALMLAGGIPLFWLEFKSKKGIIFK